jgi:dethiobiotin synthetase
MKLNQIFSSGPVFITGTDTEVGKTYTSELIIRHLSKQGTVVRPFKPISAGTEQFEGFEHPVNEDAYKLWLACEKQYDIDAINPIVFDEPIAPHIAASNVGVTLSKTQLNQEFAKVSEDTNPIIVEGAGGWMLPLNDKELLSDWVIEHNLPIILVVGVRLGCLNHALLTASTIMHAKGRLVGWVANYVSGDNDVAKENVAYLTEWFKQHNVPLLFDVQQNQTKIYG